MMVANKYQVEIPDVDYYRKLISCQSSCPVNTDARGYVNAIAEGNYELGYVRARQPNPFASTCGRVCNAPCEAACRRGHIDSPVTIRALKRFVCERYGVEAADHLPTARPEAAAIGSSLLSDSPPFNSRTAGTYGTLLKASANSGHRKGKVAVVGSGPAGITAAHDLSLLGHAVTVFEAAPVPGGQLLLGIPEYRLPRDIIRSEIEEFLKRGGDLKLNMHLGTDFTLDTLRKQGYEAIFLAIGAYLDREAGIEGADLEGVVYSLDFLRKANLGSRVEIGGKVLVIGGGGTAMDAARTALRIGEEGVLLEQDGIVALDVARKVLRLGARDVQILYRGMRDEMRAPDEEVEDTVEEGVALYTGRAPKRFLGAEGKVWGLETLRMHSSVGEDGRRVRSLIPHSEEVFGCDTVVVAIGQSSDLSFINESDNIQVARGDTIVVDPETMATTAPGVYAGGDVAFGPSIIIDAVRDGHIATRSIDQYIQGGRATVASRGWMEEVSSSDLPPTDNLNIPRHRAPGLDLDRRTGTIETENVYSEETAVEQASRCLKCHIQTVFNGDLCILCGGCVDVCPRNCYKMVSIDRIEGSQRLDSLVKARFGISLQSLLLQYREDKGASDRGTAMIKDEDRCMRCGLCAERCPVGAITMESFRFEEELVYVTDAEGQKANVGGSH